MKSFVYGLLVAVILVLIGFGVKSYLDVKNIEARPSVFKKNENLSKNLSLTNGDYALNVYASSLNWQASKLFVKGYTDAGSIKFQEGLVQIDENGLVTIGEFVIDMTSLVSLSTGSGKGQDILTKHLKSADFFDVEKYNTSQLSIKSVVLNESGKDYSVVADLTIKGITNPIEFNAEIFSINESTVQAIAEIVVDRTLWDVRYGSNKFFDNLGDNVIDDNFKIELELLANKT